MWLLQSCKKGLSKTAKPAATPPSSDDAACTRMSSLSSRSDGTALPLARWQTDQLTFSHLLERRDLDIPLGMRLPLSQPSTLGGTEAVNRLALRAACVASSHNGALAPRCCTRAYPACRTPRKQRSLQLHREANSGPRCMSLAMHLFSDWLS